MLSQAPGRFSAAEASLLIAGLAEQHHNTPLDLLRTLTKVSLVDLDGETYRLLDTIRAGARRRLRADQALLPRARAMLHSAAAALVGPEHEASLYRTHDPQTGRLLLIEEAVLDAWRDRLPGLGPGWLQLGFLAMSMPASERLVAAAGQVLVEAADGPVISADDAGRIAGAFALVGHTGLEIPWPTQRIRQFVDAVAAGSPLAVGVRAAFLVLTYFRRPGKLEELREFTTVLSELAARSGLARDRADAEHAEGWWCEAVGRYDESLVHNARALEYAPADYPEREILWNNYASSLNALGRHEEALAILRAILDRRPVRRDRWVALLTTVEALLARGSSDEAQTVADELRAELREHPGWGFAVNWLQSLDEISPPRGQGPTNVSV